MTRFLLLLLTCHGLLAASLSESAAGIPFHWNPDSRLTDETSDAAQLGEDGIPAWYWPALDPVSTTFVIELDVPADGNLLGLRLAALGGTPSLEDGFILYVEDASGYSLDVIEGILPDGHGQFEFILFEQTIPVTASEGLSLRLVKTDGSAPPFLTADGDCIEGNQSTLISGTTTLPLDRDLNVRALIEWSAGDLVPPFFQISEPEGWGADNRNLPLMVRARDESGVARVDVHLFEPEDRVWSLLDVDPDPSDESSAYYHGTGSLVGLANPEGLVLGGYVEVEDSLGNIGREPFEWSLTEGYSLGSAAGLTEEALFPAWPPIPSAAFALEIRLDDLIQEAQLIAATVYGASVQLRGEGSCRLLLVQDQGGRPAMTYDDYSLLAEPVELAPSQLCPGWQHVDFVIADSLRILQGERVWLVQEFLTYGSDPLATLGERHFLDSLETSVCWQRDLSSDGSWYPLENSALHLRAKIEALRCEFELPFVADFDASFADLECWNRVARFGSSGWLTTSEQNSNSAYFQPQSGVGIPDSIWDPDSLQSGHFVYVNSDAMGSSVFQQDTLFTPWLLQDGQNLDLSFLSFCGAVDGEEVSVLLREDHGLGAGSWAIEMDGADFAVLAADTTIDGIPHPIWVDVQHTLSFGELPSLAQLAFVYACSEWQLGWAIDDLELRLPDETPPLPPWPGALEKPVSIGPIYPNPFNPTTRIPYSLLDAGPVQIEVFNLLGQRVAELLDSENHAAGLHTQVFQPEDFAGGMYIVRIKTNRGADARRLLYLK
jgi:hypothetical protein